ncbi:MAG TPA: hypothetical protein VFZ23_05265 [Pyrinomonadaceae bacterium]
MKKLENKKIDEIGKLLVKSGSLASRDLEAIVANPGLFESVRARIAAEPALMPVRRSYFRPMLGAFASVAIVASIALSFWMSKSKTTEVVVTPVPSVPAAPAAKVSDDVKQSSRPDSIYPSELPPPATPVKEERTWSRPSVKASRPKQPIERQVPQEQHFYALSYAGDPNETERGGRIVRVDIPRSALFAMGVDIPLENETETVKADLLVGNDGVTRAIRVVK